MPTLREMAEKAHELEQRILIYNWLESQLRTLVNGNKELRIEEKPVSKEIVDAVMADVLDHRELAQQELSVFWDQQIVIDRLKNGKEDTYEPPALEDSTKPGSAKPRSKR